MSALADNIIPVDRSTSLYGHKITKAWKASVEAIIEVGRLLVEAKAEVPHGDFERMVKQKCPFSVRTARKLMQVSNHPALSKSAHCAVLPASVDSLAVLASFEPDELNHAIGNRWVAPEMTRDDVKRLHARTQKALGRRKRMPPSPTSEPRPKSFQTRLRARLEQDSLEWLATVDQQTADVVADRVAHVIEQLRQEMTDCRGGVE